MWTHDSLHDAEREYYTKGLYVMHGKTVLAVLHAEGDGYNVVATRGTVLGYATTRGEALLMAVGDLERRRM